ARRFEAERNPITPRSVDQPLVSDCTKGNELTPGSQSAQPEPRSPEVAQAPSEGSPRYLGGIRRIARLCLRLAQVVQVQTGDEVAEHRQLFEFLLRRRRGRLRGDVLVILDLVEDDPGPV